MNEERSHLLLAVPFYNSEQIQLGGITVEKSLQQLLQESLERSFALYDEEMVKYGKESAGKFSDFCARQLVRVLTPVMTAIQKHIESCPISFELPIQQPTDAVIGSVVNEEIHPFYR